MEALLSLSFDNISSKDLSKIRKGLRQIEGLLAQICLPSSSALKRRPSVQHNHGDTPAAPKSLSQVARDPAFREFFRLQEGFEWNGSSWPRWWCEVLLIRCCSGYSSNGVSGDAPRNAQWYSLFLFLFSMRNVMLTPDSYSFQCTHTLGSGHPPRSAPPSSTFACPLPP